MGRTGKPGGRPKGAKNKLDLTLRAKLQAKGVDPADTLLRIMQEATEKGNNALALKAAKELMPYVHPRLSAVDMAMSASLVPVQLTVVPRATGDS